MTYLLIKTLHIIAVTCWFAGLFYLPRLFVYHANTTDEISYQKFCVMERRLYYFIMHPALLVVILTAISMLYILPSWLKQGWLHLKLTLVFLLIGHHLLCGKYLKQFAKKDNYRPNHIFFRFFNEFPTIILIIVTILVVVKPF